MATKNIFAKIGDDDSDDEFEAKPMTKTTKKKEERKIAEKPATEKQTAPKFSESKMQEGGFDMAGTTQKGGRNRP